MNGDNVGNDVEMIGFTLAALANNWVRDFRTSAHFGSKLMAIRSLNRNKHLSPNSIEIIPFHQISSIVVRTKSK